MAKENVLTIDTSLTDADYIRIVNSTGGTSRRITLANLFASSGDKSLGGNKITSLGAPTASTDAATKNYVDSNSSLGSLLVMKHLRRISDQTFINGNNDYQIYDDSLAVATTDTDKISMSFSMTGTLTTLETFLNTITAVVIDTVNTFDSGSQVNLTLSDIYNTSTDEFLIADISSLSWDGNSDLFARITCNAQTTSISALIGLDFQSSFTQKLTALPNADSGWIQNSGDWTNIQIDFAHNLDAPLYDLFVNFLVSSDGTDNAAFTVSTGYASVTAMGQGVMIHQNSNNSVRIQTSANGFSIVNESGSIIDLDTETWYYRTVVYKLR